MAERETEVGNWAEMLPEALGQIFAKISLEEMLTVAPMVCKSWQKATMEPYCYLEIDIERWCQIQQPENIDRMLQLLVKRSQGAVQKLCFSGLCNDETFSLIASK